MCVRFSDRAGTAREAARILRIDDSANRHSASVLRSTRVRLQTNVHFFFFAGLQVQRPTPSLLDRTGVIPRFVFPAPDLHKHVGVGRDQHSILRVNQTSPRQEIPRILCPSELHTRIQRSTPNCVDYGTNQDSRFGSELNAHARHRMPRGQRQQFQTHRCRRTG
jgi:hypothetical protein